MSKLLITSAGLAEIVNAEQSGTAPVVLSHIAFGTGQYTATADMTALKSEFKRFDSVAGGAIGDNVIHLTIHDNSTDAYAVNEIGVFTESGTLFAVGSQTKPYMQKAAASETMLVVDITLTDINPDSIAFGDTNIVLNPATTETVGTVELATEAEAKAGTDTTRAMTPATAKAARDADANIVHRTGNETIAGQKTFEYLQVSDDSPYIRVGNSGVVKGTTPAGGQYWGISFSDSEGYVSKNRLGLIETVYSKEGNVSLSMGVYKPEHNNSSVMSKISIIYPADGDPYATAPTPAAGDNSTKIATTAWVNTKAANFLPLAGGTMSGTIKTSSHIFKNTDDNTLLLVGGTQWGNGAGLALYGKNEAETPGDFNLSANNGTSFASLLGKATGELKWNDKHIVRSVNGTAADAAGNVSITSVATATKATQDGNGKVIADTYAVDNGVVHKTGNETINGSKSFGSGIVRKSITDATVAPSAYTEDVIVENQDASGRLITSLRTGRGTDGSVQSTLYARKNNADGSNVQANLKVAVDGSGNPYFQVSESPATSDNSTRIATTAWANAKFLPLAGGTITGTIKVGTSVGLQRVKDDGYLELRGATTYLNGAFLRLDGKDGPNTGAFKLATGDGSNNVMLLGKADGTLQWNGKYVLNNSYNGPTSASAIILNSGSTDVPGAGLRLYGAHHSSGSGLFQIIASNGTATKALLGRANGQLSWGDEDVATIADFSKAQNGYYKFAHGLIIQWGYTTSGTVTLPTAFSTTNYSVVGTYNVDATGGSYDQDVKIRSKTTTSFTAYINTNIMWIAIGY